MDAAGERHSVNAISGDMFKHMFVGHLTPLLERLGEPLSAGARRMSSDRLNADSSFLEAVKSEPAATAVQQQIVTRCAVSDIAGAAHLAGNAFNGRAL
ncbi:MAG TPA: hypothetical protein VK670_12955, partial [Silvibacterium sp.]|nr:hypothetical protein [Silvibacterium sp.]